MKNLNQKEEMTDSCIIKPEYYKDYSLNKRVNPKIIIFKEKLEKFHLLYVKDAPESLKLLRAQYVRIIRDDLLDFFDQEKVFQMLVYLVHVCLGLHDEIKNSFNVPDDYFAYFFYAACFLIIKLEKAEQFKRIKVFVAERNLDLETIFELEKFILNKTSWRINLHTAAELQNLILRDLLCGETNAGNLSESAFDIISRSVSDWVNFCLEEWDVFKKYDQFTITFACVSLGLITNGLNDASSRIENKYSELINQNLLKRCMSDIANLVEADDEEDVQMEVEECLDHNDYTKENSLAVASSNSSLHDRMPMVDISDFGSGLSCYQNNFTSKPQINYNLNDIFSPSNKENQQTNKLNLISLSQNSTTSFSTMCSDIKMEQDSTDSRLPRKKRCKLSTKGKFSNKNSPNKKIKQRQSKVSEFIKVRKSKKENYNAKNPQTPTKLAKSRKVLKF